jgi:hypothetical protein
MSRPGGAVRQAPVWVSIIAVVLIVGAVAGALATLQRLPGGGPGFAGSGALGQRSRLDIGYVAGLAEPQGVSYSPNGSRIAILGVFTICAPSPTELTTCNHGLAILDAATGDLIRLAPVEPLIGIRQSASPASGPFVSLYGAGWTPDSAWYGIIYSVFDTPHPTTPNNLDDSGLLLINPTTGDFRVTRGDSGYFATFGGFSADRPIWNAQARNQVASSPLAPALAYAWRGTDFPVPTDPVRGPINRLPNDADTFAPVGNPDGVGAYTIWQPGIVLGPGSSNLGGQRSAFLTTFSAWSDSGSRVGVFTDGVSLPTPNQAFGINSASSSVGAPDVMTPDSYVVAPSRDIALTNVQQQIGAYGWAQVAWSPDGTRLASITCFARQGEALEVRDTLSGTIVGQANLELGQGDPGCRELGQNHDLGAYPHPNLTLAWSPDGHQLALADASTGYLSIWPVTGALS